MQYNVTLQHPASLIILHVSKREPNHVKFKLRDELPYRIVHNNIGITFNVGKKKIHMLLTSLASFRVGSKKVEQQRGGGSYKR